MAFDAVWRPRPDIKLYGVWYLDEWTVVRTFEKNNRNWFAFQAGIDGRSLLLPEDRSLIELAWTDYRIYRHRFRINHYEHRGYSLGHWMGPHAQSVQAAYLMSVSKLKLLGAYNYVKRGELTAKMLFEQYRPPLRFLYPC